MDTIKNDDDDIDKDFQFLKIAKERSRDGSDFWNDNWKLAEDDLRFLNSEQWDEEVKRQREEDQKPCLVNNVLPTFVDQIIGDQRKNRPSIKVSSTNVIRYIDDNGEDKNLKISNISGKTQYELAEVLSGLIKNIEYNCDSETSYDIAFQSAVESGMGFLRVRTDYANDESFEQDIIIDHIDNQFSVVMDYNAKERDFSDMNWCFIDEMMDKKEFNKKYPNASSDPVNDNNDNWFSEKSVKICEYMIREEIYNEVALLSDGRSVLYKEIESILDNIKNEGIKIVRKRKVKSNKVIWYKITGRDILEGPIELPIDIIPVVPVWGKALTIKNKTIFRSLIRHSKDAQRMANYWDSAATESVGNSTKAPYIAQEGHIEGYEDQWQTANTVNRSVLTYVPQYQNDRGPRREPPAFTPNAELTLAIKSADKIKSTLGLYNASLGDMGNEVSGTAIVARQRQGDQGSFVFIDNLSKSIRKIGRICIKMIPRVYDTERTVRIKLIDDKEDYIKLNEQILNDNNEWIKINDLSISKYDVVVTTGPSYATQRQEAADGLLKFAQAIPESAKVISDIIAQNLDFPGADIMAERLKKTIPPQFLSNIDKEQMQDEQKKDPQMQDPQMKDQQMQDKQIQIQQLQMQEEAMKNKVLNSLDVKIKEEELNIIRMKADTENKKSMIELNKINNEQHNNSINDENKIRNIVAESIAELMNTKNTQIV